MGKLKKLFLFPMILLEREIEKEITVLSNIVEQVSDCVIVTNAEGIIEHVNPSFEKISGYKKEEVIGKRFSPARIIKMN